MSIVDSALTLLEAYIEREPNLLVRRNGGECIIAARDALARLVESERALAEAKEANVLLHSDIDTERAAHEQTRADLERLREKYLLQCEVAESLRGKYEALRANLATAQARVTETEHDRDFFDAERIKVVAQLEAAESALASARTFSLHESPEPGGWGERLRLLLSTPTPAPREPNAKRPCKDCDYLFDIHAPCVGCPKVAEILRRRVYARKHGCCP